MSKIEWTDKTWNPVRGCTRVSAGCENCYAERQAARFRGPGKAYEGLVRTHPSGEPRWTGDVRIVPNHFDDPFRWRKPQKIFVNSMSDLFHEGIAKSEIATLFWIMGLNERHTFQVLTKRPERMLELMTDDEFEGEATYVEGEDESGASGYGHLPWPPPNVWLGVSCEDQTTYDERVPVLLETPAAVRFVSLEPLLGPIDLEEDEGNWIHVHPVYSGDGYEPKHENRATRCEVCDGQTVLDWVIVGGESGPGARPCDVGWIRSILRQCQTAGVPCFVKQLGTRASAFPDGSPISLGLLDRKGADPFEWPGELVVREFPKS